MENSKSSVPERLDFYESPTMVTLVNSKDRRNQKRWTLPRLGIIAQVYLGVLFLVTALLITEIVAWLDTEQQARAQFERAITDGLDEFQTDYDRATRELITLGNWLVDQKSFSELIAARDGARLVKYLEPWATVSVADVLIVSDKDGCVLAQVGNHTPIQPNSSLRDLPGVADALLGKRVSGLVQDHAGQLHGRVIVPMYAADTNTPIGAVWLGFRLDAHFLQYRYRKADQEIAIVYDDKLYIITLSDRTGKPWGGAPAPAAAIKAQRENRASSFFEFDTDVGTYLFKFKPIQAAPTVGLYGVGVSKSAINEMRFNLLRVLGIGILVIALCTGLGAFLFGRTLTRPLRELIRATHTMAEGDLHTPIHSTRQDELGDLARQMDRMRAQLRYALRISTIEHGRSAAMIQSMGAAAIVTDQNLIIVAVNSVAESLLRQNQNHLLGQSWDHLFNANGDAKHSTGLPLGESEMLGEQMLIMRGRFALRAQPQIKLEAISTQIQVEDAPAGFIHILHDVSTQEQIVRAKDEFIMNAAHEFRGPLASLRASIELLVEDYATMDKQDLGVMIKAMQRAVVKFQGLVENMLDVGNVQVGRFRVRAAPIPVGRLVEDALVQVTPLLQGRAQLVETKLDVAAPGFVLADRARITQVIINLLTNASKYGPEGETIALNAFSQNGCVTFQVTDRGPGILPAEQANLFQRFYRGRRAEEEGIGIGLGLALAREIVQAHGGQIGVTSQVGEGTTFWFTLPRAE